MFTIPYNTYNHSIKKTATIGYIKCVIRKKWLLLTPEEWVRQNYLQYLIADLNYPIAAIAVEKKLKIFEKNKRFDIVVYDATVNPLLLIECKSQQIKLDITVLQQIHNYYTVVQCRYMIITNGDENLGWDMELNMALEQVPNYMP